MSQYVAAYDVTDDRQRNRVSRILDRFGERVQRSVYLLWIEPQELSQLKREVGILLEQEDRFDVFPIDERPNRKRLSWQQNDNDISAVIVVGDDLF